MRKKKLKNYKVGIESETYAISLVDAPAIEENFVYMNEDKVDISLSSDEKRLVCGAVLVPDRPIYRNDGENEYYITFTKESIEKMSKEYLREYRQSNVTLQHETEVSETTMVESWIKSDMVYDKSLALGLNKELPIGTWFASFYVNNAELWDKVKSGEVKGFSVEAMVNLEDFNLSKQEDDIDMNSDTFWNKMKNLLSQFSIGEYEEKLNEDKLIGEELEKIEQQLSEIYSDEEKEKAIKDEIERHSDFFDEDVQTPIEPQEEPQVTEVVETPTSEENVAPSENITPSEEPKEEPNPLEEVVNNLKAEVEALREMNSTLQEKVKGLEKTPSAEPIKPNAKPSASSSYAAWRDQMAKYL